MQMMDTKYLEMYAYMISIWLHVNLWDAKGEYGPYLWTLCIKSHYIVVVVHNHLQCRSSTIWTTLQTWISLIFWGLLPGVLEKSLSLSLLCLSVLCSSTFLTDAIYGSNPAPLGMYEILETNKFHLINYLPTGWPNFVHHQFGVSRGNPPSPKRACEEVGLSKVSSKITSHLYYWAELGGNLCDTVWCLWNIVSNHL